MKYLSKEEIKASAPAVFTQEAAAHLSEQYVHVPTINLIDDMEKLGWNVVEAKQTKGRKRSGEFSKHLVVFRNENVVIKSEDGETVYPQVILQNSHDGASSFQFRAGLYRLVCTNGLVIATKEFGATSLRHKGYTFEELKKVVVGLVEQLPVTVETLNKFREVTLSEEQQIEIALRAIGIRFGESGAEVSAEEVLKPMRKEDEGNDLWSIFNRVQEKMVRGGFAYKAKTGRNKTARSIKNFSRDLELNEQLYSLALEFAN